MEKKPQGKTFSVSARNKKFSWAEMPLFFWLKREIFSPNTFLVFWVEKIQKTPDFVHEVTQGKKKRRRATEQLHTFGERDASPSHLPFERGILFRQPYHNPLHLGELPTNTP